MSDIRPLFDRMWYGDEDVASVAEKVNELIEEVNRLRKELEKK